MIVGLRPQVGSGSASEKQGNWGAASFFDIPTRRETDSRSLSLELALIRTERSP
jgi:hypothetical protein